MTFTKRKQYIPAVSRKKPEGEHVTVYGVVEARSFAKKCNGCGTLQPLENYYTKSRQAVGDNPDLSDPKNYRALCISCYEGKYV